MRLPCRLDRRFRERVHHALRLLIIEVFTLLLVGACIHPVHQTAIYPQGVTSSGEPSKAVVRAIKHAMGETLVPISPKRVVALDPFSAEDALALGIKLVGAPRRALTDLQIPWNPEDDMADVSWRPTNLEKVTALKPDLILGNFNDHKEIYGLLSQIAPTVLPKFSYLTWKDVFELFAKTLGKTEAFKQVMADYYKRLAGFKARMSSRLSKTHVSVFRITPVSHDVFIRGSFSGTILKDAGLARPPSQDLDASAGRRLGGNEVAYSLSRELVSKVDGDALFLIPEATTGSVDAQKALGQLQAEPLWSQLKVVKQGKVYVVGRYWVCCGPLAAHRVLDDLFRYLIE